jgi:peptidoglycan/LPS O-acetylase OafA/YrhL
LSLFSYYHFEKPMNKLVKTLLNKQSMRQPVKHEEKA